MKRSFLLITWLAFVPFSAVQADVEVDPYGFVLVNSSYNTRTVTDIPWFAAADGAGEPNFVITPRQTRLGVKLTSDAAHSPTGGVEIDFWGLRGSGSNGGPTQTAPRLRRAFMELHFEKADLLIGQEWILFSPLNPTTIMHVSLPGMMGSGNLWARLPQIRGTFKPISDDKNEVKLQAALTRPLAGDATMNGVKVSTVVVVDTSTNGGTGTGGGTGGVSQGDSFGRGELFGWPWVQARLGYQMKGDTKVGIGASVHYGQMDFGDDPDGEGITGVSMAVAGDLKIALEKVTISGEGFFGQNIKTLFSTATWALEKNDDDLVTDVDEIKSVGGWGEIKLAACKKVDIAVNAGVEQVDDEFLSVGAMKTNTTVMGNAIYKVTKGILLGLEGGYIQTERIVDATEKTTDDGRTNFNVNLSAMFKF